jgi:hypothetical protein
MRTLIIMFFLVTINAFTQELSLNKTTLFYEFSKIVEVNDSLIKEKYNKRFKEINLKNIERDEEILSGFGFTNHLVMGFATVEIHYKVKIEFKENKYRLTLTDFVLTDLNGSNPIEGLRSFKNSWINKINKKLPIIISNIENINSQSEKW